MNKVSILGVSTAVLALLGSFVEGAYAQDTVLSGDQLRPSSPASDVSESSSRSTPEPTVSYEEIWKSMGPYNPHDPNISYDVTGQYYAGSAAFDSVNRSSKNPNRMKGPRFLWSYSQGYPKPIELPDRDARRDDIDGYVRTCMSEHPGNHISIRVWYDQAGYPKQIPQSQFEQKQLEMAGWVAACVNVRVQSTNWGHANHVGVLLCEYYTDHCWGDDTIWAVEGQKNPFFDTKPSSPSG